MTTDTFIKRHPENKRGDQLRKIHPVLIIYPSLYSLLILNYLVHKENVKLAGIILSTAHIKMRGVSFTFPEASYFLLRKCGLWYALYLLFIVRCNFLFIWFWRMTGHFTGKKVMLKTFGEIIKECRIPVLRSQDINSQAAVDFINAVGGNLIVSIYNNQILRYRTCKKFQYGAVGVHNSYLPDFGGLDAAFEGLYQLVRETGVTAHLVDKGIDTGDIIRQEKISIDPRDTAFSLNIRQWVRGAEMIPPTIRDFENDAVTTQKQDLSKIKYPYRSFPDKVRVREFHQKHKRCIYLKDIFIPNDYIADLFGLKPQEVGC